MSCSTWIFHLIMPTGSKFKIEHNRIRFLIIYSSEYDLFNRIEPPAHSIIGKCNFFVIIGISIASYQTQGYEEFEFPIRFWKYGCPPRFCFVVVLHHTVNFKSSSTYFILMNSRLKHVGNAHNLQYENRTAAHITTRVYFPFHFPHQLLPVSACNIVTCGAFENHDDVRWLWE
jgi:hypothetical protein